MIVRMWHGVVPERKADAYLHYLEQTGIKDYLKTEGNRGVQVLRRIQDENAHFLTLTLWDSLDSIRRFAGNEAESAVYYPEDEEFLLEFEPTVVHYEVLVSSYR
jgi:heme-degrading monooxygenase HmoA